MNGNGTILFIPLMLLTASMPLRALNDMVLACSESGGPVTARMGTLFPTPMAVMSGALWTTVFGSFSDFPAEVSEDMAELDCMCDPCASFCKFTIVPIELCNTWGGPELILP